MHTYCLNVHIYEVYVTLSKFLMHTRMQTCIHTHTHVHTSPNLCAYKTHDHCMHDHCMQKQTCICKNRHVYICILVPIYMSFFSSSHTHNLTCEQRIWWQFLADLPLAIVEVAIRAIILYYFVGFESSVFHIFLATNFLSTSLFMVSYNVVWWCECLCTCVCVGECSCTYACLSLLCMCMLTTPVNGVYSCTDMYIWGVQRWMER